MIAFARSIGRKLRNSALGWVQRFSRRGLILMYHRIDDHREMPDPWRLCVSENHFSEHLNVLRRNFEPLPLAALLKSRAQFGSVRPVVAVTFDDGYADNLLKATPLLERHGVPATFFITSNGANPQEPFWWDELNRLLLRRNRMPAEVELTIGCRVYRWGLEPQMDSAPGQAGDPRRTWHPMHDSPLTPAQALYRELYQLLQKLGGAERQRVLLELAEVLGETNDGADRNCRLTSDEILQLSRIPCATIGGHTATHPFLPAISLAAQQSEIDGNRAALERITGSAVRHFSYPHGAFLPGTVQLVQQSGFESACSTAEGLVWKNSNAFQLPRMAVEDWSGPEFEQKLDGWVGQRAST